MPRGPLPGSIASSIETRNRGSYERNVPHYSSRDDHRNDEYEVGLGGGVKRKQPMYLNELKHQNVPSRPQKPVWWG